MAPTDPPSAATSAGDDRQGSVDAAMAAPLNVDIDPAVVAATAAADATAAASAVTSPTAATAKRSRTSLSIHEKSIVKSFCEQQLQACKTRGEPGAPSHDALRREIVAQFGWDVGRSTLSKILTMDWALLQGSAHRNPHMKRKRRPLFPVFEAELVQFISAQLSPATPLGDEHSNAEPAGDALATPDTGSRRPLKTHSLTEAMILEEAQRLKQLHGIKDEELVLSVGWLARFKHRNGIRLRKTASASPIDSKKAAISHELALAAPSISASFISALNEADSAIPQTKRLKLEAEVQGPARTTTILDQPETKTPMSYSAVCGAVRSSDRPPCPAWLTPIYEQIPLDVRRLGCVCNPIVPVGITGLSVVVIGFGSVLEAYVASALVGSEGFVTCLGCSPHDIAVGMEHMDAYAHSLGYATTNMRFVPMSPALLQPSTLTMFPELEGLQLEDLVIFNCSFHSVPIQSFALELAYAMLKEGGELLFVDTYCSRRLQQPLRSELHDPIQQPLLSVESSPEAATDTSVDATVSSASVSLACSALGHSRADEQLLHATYEEDIRRTCQQIGFLDIRRISEIHVYPQDPSVQKQLAARFTMATIRAFKLKSIDDRAEDYGQTAVYNGELAQCPLRYQLDTNFVFTRAEPARVDGNTAEILSSSWLQRFFTVTGDRSTHFGRFDPTQTLLRVDDAVSVDVLAV